MHDLVDAGQADRAATDREPALVEQPDDAPDADVVGRARMGSGGTPLTDGTPGHLAALGLRLAFTSGRGPPYDSRTEEPGNGRLG